MRAPEGAPVTRRRIVDVGVGFDLRRLAHQFQDVGPGWSGWCRLGRRRLCIAMPNSTTTQRTLFSCESDLQHSETARLQPEPEVFVQTRARRGCVPGCSPWPVRRHDAAIHRSPSSAAPRPTPRRWCSGSTAAAAESRACPRDQTPRSRSVDRPPATRKRLDGVAARASSNRRRRVARTDRTSGRRPASAAGGRRDVRAAVDSRARREVPEIVCQQMQPFAHGEPGLEEPTRFRRPERGTVIASWKPRPASSSQQTPHRDGRSGAPSPSGDVGDALVAAPRTHSKSVGAQAHEVEAHARPVDTVLPNIGRA